MTRTLPSDRILRFSRRPAAPAARPLRVPKARSTEHVTVASRPEGRVHSPVMILLVLIATLGILFYAQFLLNPANRGDLLPYLMVIGAEAVEAGSSKTLAAARSAAVPADRRSP